MFGVCEWEGARYLVGAHINTGLLIFLPKTPHKGFSYKKRKQGLLVSRSGHPINTQKEVIKMVFSHVGKTLYMMYVTKNNPGKIHVAASQDGAHFKKRSSVSGENPIGIVEIDGPPKKHTLVLFYGVDGVHTYSSTNNCNTWKDYKHDIIESPYKDGKPSVPLALSEYKNHLYLLYKVDNRILDILIDNPNIEHTIWQSSETLWEHEEHFHHVLGVLFEAGHIAIYITNKIGNHVEEILLPYPILRDILYSHVDKHSFNPVIAPQIQNEWESQATFNPAAVIDDDNVVHVLYRAIGDDGVSRLGYASSGDGYSFENKGSTPAYVHNQLKSHEGPKKYAPTIYPSGGSWGGCEDPRLTRIDDKVFMTYTAFGGWQSIRIALTSIGIEDFKNKRWDKWQKPILLSPPFETHKNWVLFPEKINGKYAILHGIAPNIYIDYVDDLENIPDYIHSPRGKGPQEGREDAWDNLVRGAGPPPIKTEEGWLLLYHALDRREMHKYKVGAMILDLNDPAKVLYRSSRPVISPDMNYENEGKPGIVYASGALVKDNTLFIYYGGGDRVSCIATAPLEKFLDTLKHGASFSGVLRTTKIKG